MSFFDLDDILCEEQLIKTKCLSDIPWRGCLYTQESFDHGQIDTGSVLELPFWLAFPLFVNNRLDISLPKCFGLRMREALQMGAKSVSLYDAAPFYFLLCQKMMNIWMDESLYQLILQAYSTRFSEIIRRAQHNESVDALFHAKLDVFERTLYRIARHHE